MINDELVVKIYEWDAEFACVGIGCSGPPGPGGEATTIKSTSVNAPLELAD